MDNVKYKMYRLLVDWLTESVLEHNPYALKSKLVTISSDHPWAGVLQLLGSQQVTTAPLLVGINTVGLRVPTLTFKPNDPD